MCDNTAFQNDGVGVILRKCFFILLRKDLMVCHSRESGNPESLEVCLEIRSGSPIEDFGDDICVEFGDDHLSCHSEERI